MSWMSFQMLTSNRKVETFLSKNQYFSAHNFILYAALLYVPQQKGRVLVVYAGVHDLS